MKKSPALIIAAIGVVALFATSATTAGAQFGPGPRYELAFTNLTKGQPMTPTVFAVDDEPLDLWGFYQLASPGLREIAEKGTAMSNSALAENGRITMHPGIGHSGGATFYVLDRSGFNL